MSVSPEATPQLEDRFFLNRAHGLEHQRIEALRQDLEAGHPWVFGEELEQVLQQWAAKAMRSPVVYSATWQPPEAAGPPAEVSMAPALILRRRAANHLLTYYEHIHEALPAPQARSPLGLAAPLEPQQRSAWRTSSAMRDEPIPSKAARRSRPCCVADGFPGFGQAPEPAKGTPSHPVRLPGLGRWSGVRGRRRTRERPGGYRAEASAESRPILAARLLCAWALLVGVSGAAARRREGRRRTRRRAARRAGRGRTGGRR